MSSPSYRRIFNELDPYYPQPKDLDNLATFMSRQTGFPDAVGFLGSLTTTIMNVFGLSELPKIPAGYTYLAQFIIHDISLDEKSDRHKREDLPWEIVDADQLNNLRNLRKPTFELENVYGDAANTGSEAQRNQLLQDHPLKLPLLRLSLTERERDGSTADLSYPCDLPRKPGSAVPDIVDERNDENLIVAQTHVAFTKFHNAIVVYLSRLPAYKDESGQYKTDALFEKARRLTIRYYQTIILTDYLPKIIQASVLEDVRLKINTEELFFRPTPDDLFIPLEFSVAAFRFGHSMIRKQYNLNKDNHQTSLMELMKFTGKGQMGSIPPLVKHVTLPSVWILDWNLFYKIDDSVFSSAEFNFAEPIDTELVFDLLTLRPKAANDPTGRANSLAAIDLYRGRRFGLPTGQDVAGKIPGAEVLSAEQIGDLITKREINTEDAEHIKEDLKSVFSEKTPLWFYILAEAELQGNGKLGVVGSRIVAETMLQLLFHSEYSILREDWEPEELISPEAGETFGMPEMFKFIEKMNKDYSAMLYPNMQNKFDEINPLG